MDLPQQGGALSEVEAVGAAGTRARAPAPRLAAVNSAPIDLAQVDVSSIDDGALMLRYRDGDVHAFEILYARHKGALYRYLQRMCRNPEAANDLFQEVWGKVIASRDRYEVRAQFNTFLFRIAHNSAIDYFRRSGRQQTQDIAGLEEELPGADAAQPDVQLSQAQLQAAYRDALLQLPQEQRDVFVLYEETGLSLEEIGKLTGVAMETAKSRLRYAVGKLRASLRRHAPGVSESQPSMKT
jgi:RNA polymerase sigma-70 factor (ECF subfamily)